MGEEGREHRFHECLAGLEVLPRVGHDEFPRHLLDGRHRRAAARSEVDVGKPGVDRGEGVDAACGQNVHRG